MNKSSILIRAEASSTRGTGHVMRCFALAQTYMQQGGHVHFLKTNTSPDLDKQILQSGCKIHYLTEEQGSDTDAIITMQHIKKLGCNWLIVDGYDFLLEYQMALKDAGHRVLFFDDYGHCSYYCSDIILNQNITATPIMYKKKAPETQLLLGTDFTVLRKEFTAFGSNPHVINTHANSILITLGGADLPNISAKILEAILSLQQDQLSIQVIVGASNPHIHTLETIAQSANCAVEVQVHASDMLQRMQWADIAFSAAGTTTWELLFMGTPFITGYFAENQKAIATKIGKMHLATSVGSYLDVSSKEIQKAFIALQNNFETRSRRSHGGQQFIDGNGAQRVVDYLL